MMNPEYDEEESCLYDHFSDDVCPECCEYDGDFQPGVEVCEFCSYAHHCREVKHFLDEKGRK